MVVEEVFCGLFDGDASIGDNLDGTVVVEGFHERVLLVGYWGNESEVLGTPLLDGFSCEGGGSGVFGVWGDTGGEDFDGGSFFVEGLDEVAHGGNGRAYVLRSLPSRVLGKSSVKVKGSPFVSCGAVGVFCFCFGGEVGVVHCEILLVWVVVFLGGRKEREKINEK